MNECQNTENASFWKFAKISNKVGEASESMRAKYLKEKVKFKGYFLSIIILNVTTKVILYIVVHSQNIH